MAFKFSLPSIKIPSFNLPSFSFPEIKLPVLNFPQLRADNFLSLPKINNGTASFTDLIALTKSDSLKKAFTKTSSILQFPSGSDFPQMDASSFFGKFLKDKLAGMGKPIDSECDPFAWLDRRLGIIDQAIYDILRRKNQLLQGYDLWSDGFFGFSTVGGNNDYVTQIVNERFPDSGSKDRQEIVNIITPFFPDDGGGSIIKIIEDSIPFVIDELKREEEVLEDSVEDLVDHLKYFKILLEKLAEENSINFVLDGPMIEESLLNAAEELFKASLELQQVSLLSDSNQWSIFIDGAKKFVSSSRSYLTFDEQTEESVLPEDLFEAISVLRERLGVCYNRGLSFSELKNNFISLENFLGEKIKSEKFDVNNLKDLSQRVFAIREEMLSGKVGSQGFSAFSRELEIIEVILDELKKAKITQNMKEPEARRKNVSFRLVEGGFFADGQLLIEEDPDLKAGDIIKYGDHFYRVLSIANPISMPKPSVDGQVYYEQIENSEGHLVVITDRNIPGSESKLIDLYDGSIPVNEYVFFNDLVQLSPDFGIGSSYLWDWTSNATAQIGTSIVTLLTLRDHSNRPKYNETLFKIMSKVQFLLENFEQIKNIMNSAIKLKDLFSSSLSFLNKGQSSLFNFQRLKFSSPDIFGALKRADYASIIKYGVAGKLLELTGNCSFLADMLLNCGLKNWLEGNRIAELDFKFDNSEKKGEANARKRKQFISDILSDEKLLRFLNRRLFFYEKLRKQLLNIRECTFLKMKER